MQGRPIADQTGHLAALTGTRKNTQTHALSHFLGSFMSLEEFESINCRNNVFLLTKDASDMQKNTLKVGNTAQNKRKKIYCL